MRARSASRGDAARLPDLDNKILALEATLPTGLQQLSGCKDCASACGCVPSKGTMQLDRLQENRLEKGEHRRQFKFFDNVSVCFTRRFGSLLLLY